MIVECYLMTPIGLYEEGRYYVSEVVTEDSCIRIVDLLTCAGPKYSKTQDSCQVAENVPKCGLIQMINIPIDSIGNTYVSSDLKSTTVYRKRQESTRAD